MYIEQCIAHLLKTSTSFQAKPTFHIRFELGDPYDNGSDERLAQVNDRVNVLFNALIGSEEQIEVHIFDHNCPTSIEKMTSAHAHIYNLLEQEKMEASNFLLSYEDVDLDGTVILVEDKIKVYSCSNKAGKMPLNLIFEGIGNKEQGRRPVIKQSIFLTCPKQGLIFYMYDDRGCIIYGADFEKFKDLHHRFDAWMVDYWKDYYDAMYQSSTTEK